MSQAAYTTKINRIIKPCLFVFCCIFIQACSDIVYLHMPLNVGLPDQIAKTNFVVEKEYTYRIALQFDWIESNDRTIRDKQIKDIGELGRNGIELPLRVTIKKNGEVLIDHVTYSNKSTAYEGFCFNKNTNQGERPPSLWKDLFFGEVDCEGEPYRERIWGPSRTIEIRTLAPGAYCVEVKTIISVEEFLNMKTFIKISPHSPKI